MPSKPTRSISFFLSLAIPLAVIALILTGLSSPAIAQSAGVPTSDNPRSITFVPDQLIVKLRPAAQANVDSWVTRHNLLAEERLFTGNAAPAELVRIYRLMLTPGSDVLLAAAALSVDPQVEWVEPDYLAYAAATPDDPLFSDQWALAKIAAPAAWDVTTGAPTVAIAVIDSGIDLSHADLSGQVWVNPGEIAGNGLDDDNNGFVDDVNGWDFVNDDNNPSDDEGHGTQVAGVAAAATDNAVGIAGMCWGCRIMPVKVMQASGVANYSDIADGVLYAAQKGARVINLSLGGYSDSHALHEAIQSAVNDYGAVVVGGAGNDHTSARFYPAAYSEVLAVAGTDASDVKTAISNYGNWVDVSAPAAAITTTFMGGDYGAAEGTSFAASFVSGLAGLVISEHSTWTPALVTAQILHTADPIDALNPGYAGLLGSGRIHAANAVTVTPNPILAIDATAVNGDPLGRPVPSESGTLQVTLGNDWLDAAGVQGTLTTSDAYVTVITGTASFGSIVPGGTGTGNPLYGFTVAAGIGYSHPIAFNLHVTANSGAYSVDLPLTLTTRSANENVGGTYAVDTTWTSDKTYIVFSNVGVAPGATLTIQAGTVVRLNGSYSLNVGGALIAGGTQSQPIRFIRNTGADWGRIYFDDTSLDASSDISGTYQSGNLLRWVQIEGAAQGIACNNATPYLSNVTLTGGGVNCPLGATTLWVQDSTLAGGLNVTGSGQIWRNTVTGGGISLSGQATIRSNIVAEGISTGGNSLVQDNTAGGPINAPGENMVRGNTVSSGGIAIGSGQVLSNTLTGGGISAGTDSKVRGNNIENSPGWGIQASGTVSITHNRLVGNASGIYVEGGQVQGNLIANQDGVGLETTVALTNTLTVISNTFTAVGGSAIQIQYMTGLSELHIQGNNFEFNTGLYDIENLNPNTTLAAIPASANWWGTTNPAVIDQRIYDYYDDYNLSVVQYAPAATGPIQSAPAYVRRVTVDPNPVGIERVEFEVEFSREMDNSTSQLWFGIGDHIQRTIIYPNLVSLWPGENNVNDIIGTNDGSLLGSTSFTTGVFGQGFLLDSDDDGITIPHDPSLNLQLPGFSFGFWMKGIKNQPQEYFDIVDKSHACGPYTGWTFEGYPSGGLTLAVNNNGGWVRVTSTMDVLDGKFHLIFGTWDGTTIRLFVDEVLQGEASLTNPADNSLPLNIGFWCNVGSRPFRGIVDEVMLYHRALSSNEIRAVSITGIPITDNPQWISPDHFRVTYDITSLISRDTYTLTVSGAVGTDGIEIAPSSAYTFIVDYSGGVGDTTAPPAPIIEACAANTPDTLSASWEAQDPDSEITLHSYAIGTTPGGTDVVNWTNTAEAAFTRSGLNLIAGQEFYISVRARNSGGLWSQAATTGVQAGSGMCVASTYRIRLPLIQRTASGGMSFQPEPASRPLAVRVPVLGTCVLALALLTVETGKRRQREG